MGRSRALLLSVAVAAILFASGSPFGVPQDDPAGSASDSTCDGPLLLGVSIGPVIPFAVYDSGSWTNIWPGLESTAIADRRSRHSSDELKQVLVRTLGETGRLPTKWWFMPLEGALGPVEIQEVFWLETHCTWNWALRTEFPLLPPRCTNCCPDPVAGVVSNLACFGERFELLPPASPLAASILDGLRERFEDEESRQIARLVDEYGSSSRFPLEAADRRRVPFKSVSAWKAPLRSGTHSLVYLSAVKEYPVPECVAPSIFSAWVLQEREAPPRPLEVRVDLTDCDYKSDSRLRPVTMVQAGGSEFVVVELGAWEGVQFGVFEVRSTSLVERIATWALDF